MVIGYVQNNLKYARQLRSRMTKAEQRLWFFLRRDQLGVRFDRQALMETPAVLEVIVQVMRQSTGEIPPHPNIAKEGANPPPSIEGFPPLHKGGQGGFGDAHSGTPA